MQSDVKDYLDIILRRKWLFVAIFSIAIVVGFLHMATLPDQYTADAVFQYQKKHPIMLLLVKDESTLASISEQVSSYSLIKKIENNMELFKNISARLSEVFPEREAFKYNTLPKRYKFNVESDNTALVKVSFFSSDRNVCFQAVKIFVEELARMEKHRDKSLVEKARKELQSALSLKRSEVESLNERIILILATESESAQQNNSSGGKGKNSHQNLPEARRLTQVERYISQLDYSKDQVGEYEKKRTQLAALQKQLGDLSIKYTDQNSIVVRVKEQIQALNEDIEQQGKDLGYLLTLNEVELRREASELRSFLQKHRDKETTTYTSPQERQIQNEIQLKHEEILHLSRRLDDLLLIESSLDEKITILAEPVLPENPIDIQKTKIFTMAIIAGFAIALLAVGLMEQFDDHILSSKEIENLTSLDSIVNVPFNAEKFGDAATIYKRSIEYFLQVATFIFTGSPPRKPILIFVTSSMPEEGKTTISTGLALAMSESSRTLLIDCDFRNPTIKEFFDIKAEHGIIHTVIYDVPKEESIVPSFKENLDIFPCTEMTKNPSRVFLSDKFRETIDDLSMEYPVIIIDTPPVSVAPDVFALSSLGMEGILIVDLDSCRKSNFIKTLKILKTFRVSMLGMILNKVSSDIRYGYYSKYAYRNYDRIKRYRDNISEKVE